MQSSSKPRLDFETKQPKTPLRHFVRTLTRDDLDSLTYLLLTRSVRSRNNHDVRDVEEERVIQGDQVGRSGMRSRDLSSGASIQLAATARACPDLIHSVEQTCRRECDSYSRRPLGERCSTKCRERGEGGKRMVRRRKMEKKRWPVGWAGLGWAGLGCDASDCAAEVTE